MREHFETWLALEREGELDEPGVPGFVERDFRQYLTCGVLAHGFGRARCPACGHDFLVALSCRARAVCPSCNARRMAEASDRAGLEGLLRYCARGPLALERRGRDPEHPEVLVYQLPKPTPEGRTALARTPLELIDRLAALIPPPRVHRHRYSGVLAPSSPWRAQVTAWAAASAGAEAEPVVPP